MCARVEADDGVNPFLFPLFARTLSQPPLFGVRWFYRRSRQGTLSCWSWFTDLRLRQFIRWEPSTHEGNLLQVEIQVDWNGHL